MKISDINTEEYICKSLSCSGCAAELATRLAFKALGDRTVVVFPASCMSAVHGFWPQTACLLPEFTSAFGAQGAIVQGLSAGFKHRGLTDINVVTIAGDGGTADIGMSSFSQAIVSGRKFIYICVDNEAYMNTGIQTSSTTPAGAKTTTNYAPVTVGEITRSKKDLFNIAVAHRIPYAAKACVSYPLDYYAKVQNAIATDGPSFVHVLVPCSVGWGFPTEKVIEIGRMAVESGMWQLLEYKGDKVRQTYTPKKKISVRDYVKAQSRFSLMKDADIAHLQNIVDKECYQDSPKSSDVS